MLFTVHLDTIKKAEKFCKICNQYKEDIDIKEGKYIVNGKSILGLLSLDLTKNLIVRTKMKKGLSSFLIKIKEFMV